MARTLRLCAITSCGHFCPRKAADPGFEQTQLCRPEMQAVPGPSGRQVLAIGRVFASFRLSEAVGVVT